MCTKRVVFPERHLEAEKYNKCFNVPTKDMTTVKLLKRKHDCTNCEVKSKACTSVRKSRFPTACMIQLTDSFKDL